MKMNFTLFAIILFIFSGVIRIFPQTIDQRLNLDNNQMVNGGNFTVSVQVKGTSLSSANTLGSATIDVYYDAAKLNYVNATSWAFGAAEGYTRSATLNSGFIRILVLGNGVNQNLDGTPAGFDVGSSYQSWVTLNFTISSTSGTASLYIDNSTNQIGLFENHSNNPTGSINDQTLSAPINISNAPLPVELSTFTASVNVNNVNLSWKTATEVNNNGFEVQRAVRGQKSEVSRWEKVGFVEGHGNSNSPKEYTYTDKNLTGGTKFVYRLKQIDNDGQYQYSKEIEVEVVPKEYTLYQNYPNPFNPVTEIKYNLPEASRVILNVYNIIGQQVASLINGTEEAGYHSVVFEGRDLPSGTYIYRLQTNNFVQTKKMVLLK